MKKFFKKLLNQEEDVFRIPSKPMIIAVDFDGTCVQEAYPEIGPSLPGAVETLLALSQRDHKLILWTCREGEFLEEAVNWFKDNGIPLAGVNETPLDEDFRPEGGRKVYANLYIDDRILGGFPGWNTIHKELLGMPLVAF